MNIQTASSIFAFLSLIMYSLSLLPGLLHFTNPDLLKNNLFMIISKHRRNIGVLAFVFGLMHGISVALSRNIDFSQPSTYLKYSQGILLLGIFLILSLTSNNWSIHHLKQNWKKLHRLTYLVMFVLVWHIIDKMSNSWSLITPLALGICLILISLFTERKLIEKFGD